MGPEIQRNIGNTTHVVSGVLLPWLFKRIVHYCPCRGPLLHPGPQAHGQVITRSIGDKASSSLVGFRALVTIDRIDSRTLVRQNHPIVKRTGVRGLTFMPRQMQMQSLRIGWQVQGLHVRDLVSPLVHPPSVGINRCACEMGTRRLLQQSWDPCLHRFAVHWHGGERPLMLQVLNQEARKVAFYRATLTEFPMIYLISSSKALRQKPQA